MEQSCKAISGRQFEWWPLSDVQQSLCDGQCIYAALWLKLQLVLPQLLPQLLLHYCISLTSAWHTHRFHKIDRLDRFHIIYCSWCLALYPMWLLDLKATESFQNNPTSTIKFCFWILIGAHKCNLTFFWLSPAHWKKKKNAEISHGK